ncbi:hypothetical protein D3C76_1632310 [compost metagenome]
MLNRLVDVAVSDQLNNPTFFNWREYVNRLKRNIFAVHNSTSNTVVFKGNILFEIWNQFIKQSAIDHLAGFCQDFSSRVVNQRLSKTLIEKTVLNV